MGFRQALKEQKQKQSGIALFMVISAVAVLTIIVTEFTYVAQMNQVIAYDGLDQLKAHYLAKSGMKLSLLRLKAYEQIKKTVANLTSGGGAEASSMVPKQILDKIWSFPFIYPIPTNIPGLTLGDKSVLDKFQKESNLEGSFTALIESDSSRYNLNSIIEGFSQPAPSPSASASGRGNNPNAPTGPSGRPNPNQSQSPTPSFSPQIARQALEDYLTNIMKSKIEGDDGFAREYRDFPMKELMDQIFAWADKKYERQFPPGRDEVPTKKAPFNRVSELHYLPLMNDELYDLFSPSLTVSKTAGINVNTMKEPTLRALIPTVTQEQVTEFFKYRDSEEEDHLFKSEEDFFKYVGELIFERNANQLEEFKKRLTESKVRIITDESAFKITVQARVNQSSRTIEAWVTLGKEEAKKDNKGKGSRPNPTATQTQTPNDPNNPNSQGGGATSGSSTGDATDPGLRITFMRFF